MNTTLDVKKKWKKEFDKKYSFFEGVHLPLSNLLLINILKRKMKQA